MQKTSIEWVKNPDGSQGYTWNPITGCLNHTNGLCNGGGFPCYAYKLAHGRLRDRYLANTNMASVEVKLSDREYDDWERQKILSQAFADPFRPRFWLERLEIFKKRYWQLRTCISYPKKLGIFTCDMSDLFGISVPEEWTRLVLEVIRINNYDRFYLLTKQPQNLPQWSPFPENCWVGVTATNAKMAEEAGFWLWEVKAKVKFISFEPLLERIPAHFSDYLSEDIHGIKWAIIGAQTKPSVYPKIEWVQEMLVACHNANIPVFMKDNLQSLLDKSVGWEGWKLRQELPDA